jgi:hypothetical protein
MRLPESTAHVQPGTQPAGRPQALPVLFDNIPAELRALNQWVLWRYEWKPPERKQKGKWDKVPYTASGWKADSTRPETWATFAQVRAAYEAHGRGQLGGRDDAGGWDGVGFVPLPENNLTVVDLDKCRDKDTGDVQPRAAAVVEKVDTYAEASPSGTGLRVVAFGHKPDHERSKKGPVEMYDGLTKGGKPGGRYLTFTGHRLGGCPATVNERQPQVEALYYETFGQPRTLPAAGRAGSDGAPDPAAVFRAEAGLTEYDPLPPEVRAELDRLVRDCESPGDGDRSKADFACCCWAIRRGIDRDLVFGRLASVGKTAVRGREYFDRTWQAAEQAVAQDGAPSANGHGPPPSAGGDGELITCGPLRLRITDVVKTAQTTTATVDVLGEDGLQTLDRVKVSAGQESRKAAVASLGDRAYVGREVAKVAVAAVLVQAEQRAKAQTAARAAGKAAGKTLSQIVNDNVPPEAKPDFRDDKEHVWVESWGVSISREKWVARLTHTVVDTAMKATDAPRRDDQVNRAAVIHECEAELRVLWGRWTADLPDEAGAVHLGPASKAAQRSCQHVVRLLRVPQTFEVASTQVGTSGQKVAARASLLSRALSQLEGGKGTQALWTPVLGCGPNSDIPVFAFWWAHGAGCWCHLALEGGLGEQAQPHPMPIPGVRDAATFHAVGRRYGWLDAKPPVLPPTPDAGVLAAGITQTLLASVGMNMDGTPVHRIVDQKRP